MNSGIRRRIAEQRVDNVQHKSQVAGEPCHERLHTESNLGNPIAGSDRIYHWVRKLCWPQSDFQPDLMAGRPLKRSRSSSASQPPVNDPSATPSDQLDREVRSAPYRDARYRIVLETKGSYFTDSEAGMLAADAEFCRSLLAHRNTPPSDTLFDDPFFSKTLDKIAYENETRVIRDIGHLISPSAECLAIRGLRQLDTCKESTNAGWNNAIPFEGPRPQPDFSVGLGRKAFSNEQMKKLNFDLFVKTYYTATYQIFFPFLTTEVKCGIGSVDIADNQNAHSMTVAVRGIVELYRAIGRATELHRKVLAFSISHDNCMVQIYAHYPEVHGPDTKYYRHLLKFVHLLSEDGKDRWAPYQFVRNVYDSFLPMHLSRIREAIDQLPDPDFGPIQLTQGNPQTLITSAPLSQVASGSMDPPSSLGANAALRQEYEQLRQQTEQLRMELQEAKKGGDKVTIHSRCSKKKL